MKANFINRSVLRFSFNIQNNKNKRTDSLRFNNNCAELQNILLIITFIYCVCVRRRKIISAMCLPIPLSRHVR